MSVKKIGLVVAMQEEVNLIKEAVNNFKVIDDLTHEVLHYHSATGVEIFVIRSGIGKVNAAVATTLLISKYNPDVIMNIGIAGGVTNEIHPGDVVISNSCVYYDVDVTVFGYQHGQVPMMPAHYTCKLPKTVSNDKYTFNIFEGVLCTGDSFLSTKDKLEKITGIFPTIKAIDMEGAAIAQTCFWFKTPFISLKGISDNVDNASAKNSEDNLEKAMKNVVKLYNEFIENFTTCFTSE